MRCLAVTSLSHSFFSIIQIASAAADMAAMMDMDTDTVKDQFSSGFILVKPTNCSICVWRYDASNDVS